MERPSDMSLPAGKRLGHFEILEAIGAGGMGQIYKARDTRLGRDVALKILPPELASHPGFQERFEREARIISSLNHPHICVLHDIGREAGLDYLVREYLQGESLAARLQRGPLPPGELRPGKFKGGTRAIRCSWPRRWTWLPLLSGAELRTGSDASSARPCTTSTA